MNELNNKYDIDNRKKEKQKYYWKSLLIIIFLLFSAVISLSLLIATTLSIVFWAKDIDYFDLYLN